MPPTVETAQNLFRNLFFNPERYDLSKVGRLKFEPTSSSWDESLDNTVLTKREHSRERPLPHRSQERQGPDRRHRPFGQPARARGGRVDGETSTGIGLVRMERAIKRAHEHVARDRDAHAARLDQCQPVSAWSRKYFGSSQLFRSSWTRPTAVRGHAQAATVRLLGPGGLTRERAGFEVRDVHTTHYGRICPKKN